MRFLARIRLLTSALMLLAIVVSAPAMAQTLGPDGAPDRTVPPSGIEPAPSGLQPDAQTTYARGAKRSPWESNPPGSVGQTDRLTRGVGEQWTLGEGRESNPHLAVHSRALCH